MLQHLQVQMLGRHHVLLSKPKLNYYIPVSYTHLDVYKRQGITFIGVILISKEYFKNNFVNHSMLVMEKQFKNDNYLILSCNDL